MATEFTQSHGASGPICCFFFLLLNGMISSCHHTGLSTRKMHQRISQDKWTAREERKKFNLSVLKNRRAPLATALLLPLFPDTHAHVDRPGFSCLIQVHVVNSEI